MVSNASHMLVQQLLLN